MLATENSGEKGSMNFLVRKSLGLEMQGVKRHIGSLQSPPIKSPGKYSHQSLATSDMTF